MSTDEIYHNAQSLRSQLRRIGENVENMFHTQSPLKLLDNSEWLANMTIKDYVRHVKGKFGVQKMLRLGPIRARIESGHDISINEFLYQTLQSYDFYVLSKDHNCFCQLGGSDQFGNIEAGYNYIRSVNDNRSVGVCLPLLTDAAGNKIGKSTTAQDVAVWLDENKTSPYAFYQFFRQLHDNDAEKFLRYFSLKPTQEVEAILVEHNKNLGRWVAQTSLADELTEVVHGRKGLELAQRSSRILFHGLFSFYEC
jgi:tyrosyl-tRNA synthetase